MKPAVSTHRAPRPPPPSALAVTRRSDSWPLASLPGQHLPLPSVLVSPLVSARGSGAPGNPGARCYPPGARQCQSSKFRLHVPDLAHRGRQLLLTSPPALSGLKQVLFGQTSDRTGAGVTPWSAVLVSSRYLHLPTRPWVWSQLNVYRYPLRAQWDGDVRGHRAEHSRNAGRGCTPRGDTIVTSLLLQNEFFRGERPSCPQKPGEREEDPFWHQRGPRCHGVCGALSPLHLAVQCCWPEAALCPN